ncbi:hypothetical protein F5884DRAFT_363817 [Xylogone sp. PMI_703]|nr:hypothetical protein F5884DRAFT_363817 [Xylogone sp. PMI_703]
MTTQTILSTPPPSSQYFLRKLKSTNMDERAAEKEERKREYNRLAQREFRRRRKEHLKKLEQAQLEQNSEQSEEIERLRYQNEELRRENEALRSQLYGAQPSSHFLGTSFTAPGDGRSYSLSPSISGASLSGAGSPTAPLVADALPINTLPINTLSLTTSMIPPPTYAYSDTSSVSNISNLQQSQAYMVHSSGLHHNTQSSPETSDFRGTQLALGSSFQSLDISRVVEAEPSRAVGTTVTPRASSVPLVQFDKNKARSDLLKIFHPYFKDQAVVSSSSKHLAALRSLKDTLPEVLKPSRAQLDTPHYYEIDLLPSPSLRDRLMGITEDVARTFISEASEAGQITIWGDDALNEVSWEMSQALLERWGWLVGREWIVRANYWRQQRGAQLLAEW